MMWILVWALIASAFCNGVQAQAKFDPREKFDPTAVAERARKQLTRDPAQSKRHYIQMILNISDDGFVTGEMIEAQKVQQRVKRRAQLISQVYQFDIDGDGLVTRAEIENLPKAGFIRVRRSVDAVMILYSHDLDQDEALSFHEVLSYAHQEAKSSHGWPGGNVQHEILMGMDMDGDGRVGVAEVIRFIDAEVEKAEAAKPQVASKPYRLVPEKKK